MSSSTTSSPKKQLTLFVTFYIKPDLIPDWLAAHRPVWAACAKEPECLFFDVFQDPQQLGKFRFVEVWSEDLNWFMTKQMTKPYYETLWEKSEWTYAKDREIEFFERFGEGSIFREGYLDEGVKMD